MNRKPKPIRIQLPEALRTAIRDSGKSSYQLAAETGVSHTVLSRFLRGERDIRLETAEQLAAAVGMELRPARRQTRKRTPQE